VLRRWQWRSGVGLPVTWSAGQVGVLRGEPADWAWVRLLLRPGEIDGERDVNLTEENTVGSLWVHSEVFSEQAATVSGDVVRNRRAKALRGRRAAPGRRTYPKLVS